MALLLEQEVFSMDAKLLKAQINEITACRAKEWVRTKSALLQLKAVQWSAAKINLNIFSLRDFGVTDEESSITQVKLFSKNNWFLRLQDDGNVSGTREQNNDEVNLQLRSIGKGLIQIYSPAVGRYLAMDSNGRLFSMKSKTDSTIFKHVQGINGFHTFSSHKYYRETAHDMYIAVRKDGLPRKGNKACSLHKGSQFLII